MKKFNGFFSDWIFTNYIIISPDMKYRLWVRNGFLSFGDYDNSNLIDMASLWDKWLLWREYKRECRRRLYDKARSVDSKYFIDSFTIKK